MVDPFFCEQIGVASNVTHGGGAVWHFVEQHERSYGSPMPKSAAAQGRCRESSETARVGHLGTIMATVEEQAGEARSVRGVGMERDGGRRVGVRGRFGGR